MVRHYFFGLVVFVSTVPLYAEDLSKKGNDIFGGNLYQRSASRSPSNYNDARDKIPSKLADLIHVNKTSTDQESSDEEISSVGDHEAECECENKNCGCCAYLDLNWPYVNIQETVCANVSYLPDEYGLRATLVFDDKVLINVTVSASNPPPLCLVGRIFSACLDLYNLSYKNKKLSGCLKFEFRVLWSLYIKSFNVRCFTIPLLDEEIDKAETLVKGINDARKEKYARNKLLFTSESTRDRL